MITYKNGNVTVTIEADGTKTREWEYNDSVGTPWDYANTLFPETIDIKITNYCDAGCKWCHEKSTKSGKHGDTATIIEKISELPPHIELAIGGGNPLDHPDLDKILAVIKANSQIANITVNGVHIQVEHYFKQLKSYIDKELVKGVGISYNSTNDIEKAKSLESDHIVMHMIGKVHSYDEILHVAKNFKKVLILGYKNWGRGATYINQKTSDDYLLNSKVGFKAIKKILYNAKGTICFDNLALEMYGIKQLFSPTTWDSIYMGDDGSHTGYIDFVEKKYSKNSYSKKRYQLPEEKWHGAEKHWLININE